MRITIFALMFGSCITLSAWTAPNKISEPKKTETEIKVVVPKVEVQKNGSSLTLTVNVNINGLPALSKTTKSAVYNLKNGQKLQMRADLMSDFTRFLRAGHNILLGKGNFVLNPTDKSADQLATSFLNQALDVMPKTMDETVYLQHLVGAIAVLQQSVKQDVVIAKAGGLLMDYTPDPKTGANKLTFFVSDKGIDAYQEHYGKKVSPGKKTKNDEESYRIISTFNSDFKEMKAQIKITKLN